MTRGAVIDARNVTQRNNVTLLQQSGLIPSSKEGQHGRRLRSLGSLSGQIVGVSKFQRKSSDDTGAIDMRECIGLVRDRSPAGATRCLHGSYFDLDIARALWMLIHLGAEEMYQFAFGYRLFGHGFAPFDGKLTINVLSGKLSSPIGKQIVNVPQLVLGDLGCVLDRVRLLPICRQRNDTPVRFEASVVDARDADSSYTVTTRQSAKLLQDDQFEIFLRNKLLWQKVAPVRVATLALLPSDCSCASRNRHSAAKNGLRVPGHLVIQVELLGQLDALTKYAGTKVRMVVVTARHCAPAFPHWHDDDGFSLPALRVDAEHQRQQISQIVCRLSRNLSFRVARHCSSADQSMMLRDTTADLSNAARYLVSESRGMTVMPAGPEPRSGSPAFAVAKDLNDELFRDLALPAEFMLDDEFEFSWSVQAGHVAILAVSDRSTTMEQTSSDVLFVLIRDSDPALDRVVGLLPVGGKRRNTALVDAAGKRGEFLQRRAFCGSDAGRGAGRGRLSSQTIDQPSGIIYFAIQCSLEDCAAVSGFQKANFVGHCAGLADRADSQCTATNIRERSLRALPERQDRGRLRIQRLMGSSPLSKARDHRPPFGVVRAIDVVPPLFSYACPAPGDWVEVAEAIVIVFTGPSDRHRDGWAGPHDAAGADAQVFAVDWIRGFIDDDGELFQISSEEEADKVVRVDDTNKIGRHVAKPEPPVEIPVERPYRGQDSVASRFAPTSLCQKIELPQIGLYSLNPFDGFWLVSVPPAGDHDSPAQRRVRDNCDHRVRGRDRIVLPQSLDNEEGELVSAYAFSLHWVLIADAIDLANLQDRSVSFGGLGLCAFRREASQPHIAYSLILARRVDPALNGFAGVVPLAGDCGGASRFKPFVELEDRGEGVSFGNLHCARDVGGQRLRGQATDKVSCLFEGADRGGGQDRSAVTGLQKTGVVAHGDPLPRSRDSQPSESRHRPTRQANDFCQSAIERHAAGLCCCWSSCEENP